VHLIGCVLEENVMEWDVTTRHPEAEATRLYWSTKWVPSTNPLIRHLLHSFVDLRLNEIDKIVVKTDENFDAEYKRMDMAGRGTSWCSMKAAGRKASPTQTLVSNPHTPIDTAG
jgi:hypothetical protein